MPRRKILAVLARCVDTFERPLRIRATASPKRVEKELES
jgi:hypothetical protein